MSELPAWAVVKPARLEHIKRVVALVESWADAAGVGAAEKQRWSSAAWLHDAFRDEQHAALREQVPEDFRGWPGRLLHGPAAALRLRAEGFQDEGVLRAVAYHTVGHPDLDAAGRALYLADFLEPGRHFDPVGRAVMRARMPHDEAEILRDILRDRITHMMSSGRKIRSETLAFWNSIAR